jgi:hypothetical protein
LDSQQKSLYQKLAGDTWDIKRMRFHHEMASNVGAYRLLTCISIMGGLSYGVIKHIINGLTKRDLAVPAILVPIALLSWKKSNLNPNIFTQECQNAFLIQQLIADVAIS